MASPQAEDGHIDIANDIVEKFATINLSPYEWRILWAIFRKTYGWHKKMDFVSVSQLEDLTQLDRRNVGRAKKSLIDKNLLVIDGHSIGFNKDWDTWKVSSPETTNIVYRDTRPKWFPPPGYRYKSSHNTLCGFCFNEFSFNGNINNHHILPKSMGGKDIKENTIFVCLPCHHKLHEMIKEFLIVNPDDRQGCYRHFVSLISSLQTTFLSSLQTTTKEKKETIQKKKEEETLPEKKLFGHLLLTEDEHEKLKVKYNSHFQELLDYMNLKIESKGIKKWRKEYESDYATIGVWERKGYFPEKIKVAEQKPAQPQKDTPKKTEVFEHEDPDPEKIKQVNDLVDNLASQMGVTYKR